MQPGSTKVKSSQEVIVEKIIAKKIDLPVVEEANKEDEVSTVYALEQKQKEEAYALEQKQKEEEQERMRAAQDAREEFEIQKKDMLKKHKEDLSLIDKEKKATIEALEQELALIVQMKLKLEQDKADMIAGQQAMVEPVTDDDKKED